MALKAMVFDVGNVLFEWAPEKLYDRLIADPADRRRFLEEICPPEWNLGFDRGESKPEGVERHADTWEIAEKLYPALTEFDLVVVSGREGTIKPEPEIYAILESRIGFPPDSLFFADDSPANVAAARARGWTAHLFRGAHGLRQALIDADLLKPHEAPLLDPA